MMADRGVSVVVQPHLFSRLLYANPVCMLTCCSDDGTVCTLMTISWITAINNHVCHPVCLLALGVLPSAFGCLTLRLNLFQALLEPIGCIRQ